MLHEMKTQTRTLADRMGRTAHVSPLGFKARKLSLEYPCEGVKELEEWLVEVANARGARIVQRPSGPACDFRAPPVQQLSNEELVAILCLYQNRDVPQILRLAAQLITAGKVDVRTFKLIAERERIECVVAELADLALKVEPEKAVWQVLRDCFHNEKLHREPLLHWTRLAQPVMKDGRVNASKWVLDRWP